jgi:purine-binding chemotaxis protein CheW
MQAASHDVNPKCTGGEFLSFTLGGEEYGVEILRVQEIRGYDSVTAIAHAPDFVKGVINLRGTIVPIVDLRIKFALGSASYDEFTVVIILSVADRVIGVVVDGVSDVISLQPEAVQPPPQLGRVVDTDYILGMGSRDENMIILVDIERLLRSTDFGLLDAPAATAVH